MACRLCIITVIFTMFLMEAGIYAQSTDTVFSISAIIYDEAYVPISATHVININTYQGDVTDSLGIFSLPVHTGDTLLVRNIAFRDTLVPVKLVRDNPFIKLRSMRYELQEARIFKWGASYEDFQEAFLAMPMQQTLGASMGLPQQDPEKVPMEMNEDAVKSVALLLTQPISYFYYNFSKHAKSARKVYWLERNQGKQEQFDAIFSKENLSSITGLKGTELQEFQLFLSGRVVCDISCSELEIYSEIYSLWKVYQDLAGRGMLPDAPDPKKEGE